MATLEEFLLRSIALTEEFLALEPGTDAFSTRQAEFTALNDDFEEATTPGGNDEWFAISSLLTLAIKFGKDPTDPRRQLVVEKSKALVREEGNAS